MSILSQSTFILQTVK